MFTLVRLRDTMVQPFREGPYDVRQNQRKRRSSGAPEGGTYVTNSHSGHSGQPIAPVNGAHVNGAYVNDTHGNGQNGEVLLKVSEVADLMNAHPNSVRRWADIGLLPSYRIGQRGDRRFKLQDVYGFLSNHNKFQRTTPKR
jgi:excisionase family DNA binding protein